VGPTAARRMFLCICAVIPCLCPEPRYSCDVRPCSDDPDHGAGGASGDPAVCGAMTSGGTESILSAVKASRDYMRAKRGIRHPEMVIANSAHAAFYKAAEFFNIRLITVCQLL